KKALEALKNRGIKFIIPSKEAVEEWRSKARTASVELIKDGFLTQEAADTLDKHLADYYSRTNKDK
ncbi:MAG: hypothetical protein KAR45_07065, partial [Desulfobacteraceae bacterium]|nr:hypothetical protein [Desulfobacteraceae bacterium]